MEYMFCRQVKHLQRPGPVSSIKTCIFLGHKQDLWLWRSLQKHIQPIIRTDHLDNTVLVCCTELPFGLMPCSLSLSHLLSFPHSLLLICLARFVVWACFALKSLTSVGIRKLDWTECIQLLIYCRISTVYCYSITLSILQKPCRLLVSLCFNLFQTVINHLAQLTGMRQKAPCHVARHWW